MEVKQKQDTLWCLPYDTDSVFKTFLKVPFSHYLNNLISNEYFPRFQAEVAKEINSRSAWNQKCWLLVQFFQYLNQAFDINTWDSRVNFIEENHLRNIMGYFRLWIDTERLYLLNFLKLDSNEFQEDRIFMTLFRTLIFFNSFFNEYLYSDFDPTFLRQFISNAQRQLKDISLTNTIETAQIANAIINLLKNLAKNEKILIDLNTLQTLKKSATVKVSKQSQMIHEVEARLQNSALFKNSLDEQVRLRKISKMGDIEKIALPVRPMYDPIFELRQEYERKSYNLSEQQRQVYERDLKKDIGQYKQEVLGHSMLIDDNVYNTLEKRNHNPYELKNFQLFGEVVKIDMDNKTKYEKAKVVEVASIDENDKHRFFYEENFTRMVESAHSDLGRVTHKDINTKSRNNIKKQEGFKNNDQNTRVFNLKWHHNPNSSRLQTSEENESKDYDNNLLFKSPLEENALENKRNNLDRLKQEYGVASYTIAINQQAADEIFQGIVNSQGSTLFIRKMPQLIETQNYRLVNNTKFDFMRKVVAYMAAQKKIQKVLAMKPVPELYPRHYCDVRQLPYDPSLQVQKIDLAMGRRQSQPKIFL